MKLRSAFLATGLLAAAFASAASPVGAWTGKIQIKMPPMPANTPPAQKAMVTKMMADIQKAKFLLTVNANKTYTMKIVGMRANSGKTSDSGTWSQTGNSVSFKEGKPGGKSQAMVLSKDGKKMVLAVPGGQGTITFTR